MKDNRIKLLIALSVLTLAFTSRSHRGFAAAAPATVTATSSTNTMRFTADKQTLRPNGARLEGHAHIASPQLDVSADVINFEFSDKQVQKVTARGGVHLNIAMTPQGGGAISHVDAVCATATLQPETRILVLDGGVKGKYANGDGPSNLISAKKMTLKYDDAKNLNADLEGDAAGVSFVLPAEDKTSPTAMGTVTVSAQRATLNTVTGLGQFIGNARAVSDDAANKFDVSAPSFTVSRGATGSIDTLTTNGRTSMKFDLPPDPAAAPAAPGKDNVGKPTHFEVEADGAVMERATSVLTLKGAVKGFYLLSKPNAEPTRQNFSCDKAVIRYIAVPQATAEAPAGLSIEMSGTDHGPVSIDAPLGLSL